MQSNLISSAEEILELSKVLMTHKVIAFDTEFIRESTFFPIVEIIQVATDTQCWLVDAQAFKKKYKSSGSQTYDPGLQPLLDVFQNKQILKVLHAAQGDQECLYTSFGILASPTLDTAVAASLCGYGDAIGLGKLLQLELEIVLAKGHARTNWSVRPLPDQLLDYALSDVKHLVELGERLIQRLDQLGRTAWALELSAKWEDKSLFETDIEKMAEKLSRGRRLDKRSYAALLRLIEWRENRVRYLNIPRRWIADDHVLLDLAQVRPKDFAHLSTFRGLNKGELKTSGEDILKALQLSAEDPDRTLPKTGKAVIPTQEEAQVLDLLRCYISILADEHRIAAKHLTTTQQLLPLLRNVIETRADLGRFGILNEEAASLIGDELVAMVQGKRALTIKDHKLQIKKIDA